MDAGKKRTDIPKLNPYKVVFGIGTEHVSERPNLPMATILLFCQHLLM